MLGESGAREGREQAFGEGASGAKFRKQARALRRELN
eukprot:SAG11_NODE_497_length_8941_cov_5.441303_3_plen_37_part_00